MFAMPTRLLSRLLLSTGLLWNHALAQDLVPVTRSVDPEGRLTHALDSRPAGAAVISEDVWKHALQSIAAESEPPKRLGMGALLGVAQLAGLGGGNAVQLLETLRGERGSIAIRARYLDDARGDGPAIDPKLLQMLRVQALWQMNAEADLLQMRLRGEADVRSSRAQSLIAGLVGDLFEGRAATVDTHIREGIDVGETVLCWFRSRASRIGGLVAADLRRIAFEQGQAKVREQGASLAPSMVFELQSNIGLVELLSWELGRTFGAPIVREVLVTQLADTRRIVRLAGEFDAARLHGFLEARGWSCRTTGEDVEASVAGWTIRATNVRSDDAVALVEDSRLWATVRSVGGLAALEGAQAWLVLGAGWVSSLGVDGFAVTEGAAGVQVVLAGTKAAKEACVRAAFDAAAAPAGRVLQISAPAARHEAWESRAVSLLAADEGLTAAWIESTVVSRLLAEWICSQLR